MGSATVRIYIAGPIFGKVDRNRALFRRAADSVLSQLLAMPVIPEDIKPAEHPGQACPPGRRSEGATHNEGCYLRTDIATLVTCEGICLLPEWMNSVGARLEMQIGAHCGLTFYNYDDSTGKVVQIR